MAERTNARLLKSRGTPVPVGSNPTPSATTPPRAVECASFKTDSSDLSGSGGPLSPVLAVVAVPIPARRRQPSPCGIRQLRVVEPTISTRRRGDYRLPLHDRRALIQCEYAPRIPSTEADHDEQDQ